MTCCWVLAAHSETLTESLDQEEYCSAGSEECTSSQSAGKLAYEDVNKCVCVCVWGGGGGGGGWSHSKS